MLTRTHQKKLFAVALISLTTLTAPAQRLGTDLNGRQYTITVRASDNAGNAGSASAGVTVAHDQRH